jgi:hypothetical protein
VVLGLSSCRTTRKAPASMAVAKPMSTAKLIRNIENNAFDYKHLSIKRIVCQFDNGKVSTSFRANIQAEKNEQITMMINKLSIPVARLWLTPDSVKFINYLENNYFLDDYSYLSSKLDMNLDFQMVNAIITNDVFSLRDHKSAVEDDYLSSIQNGMYVLQSIRKQQLPDHKFARRLRKGSKPSGIVQTLYVDPGTYKINQLTIEDAQNKRKVDIKFSDFTEVGKQLYPGEISLSLISPDNNMDLKIKLGNFSLEKERSVRFKVPEKFTRTGHE